WKEAAATDGLLKSLPMAGKVIKRSGPDSIGVFTYVLSNGATVLVKPTDFKNDEVVFTGFSAGGTSVYPDSQFMSASNAAQLIASNGVADLDPVALSRVLTGKSAQAGPFIQEHYDGIQGGASPADLETALQLLYLEFTAPRKDTVVFNGIINRVKASMIGRSNNPDAVFADSVSAILGMHHFRRLPLTEARIDQVNLDEAYRIYKERFANAGTFTFIFTGSIDTSKFIPLMEQYIGSLPGHAATSSWKDLGIHMPEGKVSSTVYKGNDNKATVNLIISGKYTYNEVNNMDLSALGAILQYRITERIREAESGAYSPRAGVNFNKLPDARYAFSIQITCAPANVEKLIAATREEITKLKTEGPSADDLAKFTAETSRSEELQLRNNGFWLQYISGHLQNQDPMSSILHFNERLKAENIERLKKAANVYFNDTNFIRLVHMPEQK
ncbi:MAG TPA: insulinase family protein, partial [Chitinophaga sp.]